MAYLEHSTVGRRGHLGLSVLGGLALLAAVLLVIVTMSATPPVARADPIEPPGGYPKLSLSVKTVTPTLAATGGVTLYYTIQIQNTGAYTAFDATLTDIFPAGTTYNGDASSSVPTVTVTSDTLTWVGDVGFDATVVVSFSLSVDPTLSGTVRNMAVISHPLIPHPVAATAETVVTDHPILTIEKSSAPAKPGADKPLIYTLVVANMGQPAVNLPITVTDRVPASTTVLAVGGGGTTDGSVVTWTRTVSLDLGDTLPFTFSVTVGDVPSGTVIANDEYRVASPETGVTAGEPYTVTIVAPIFLLSKETWPDPPGSNREMTYILTLVNVGSLAESLVITDRVPAGVTYVRGGSESDGVVSWTYPRLDTGQAAQFTYTVYISDVMGVSIVNADYWVCSAEEVCKPGERVTSTVRGPTFQVRAFLDPIAKKPGGGPGTSVTPTLVLRNLGPGNALDVYALLAFGDISVAQGGDLRTIPPSAWPFPRATCPSASYDKCYSWIGDLGHGETITFTTVEPQTTIGGEEGSTITATLIVTDELSTATTSPITGTAIGKITHLANLNLRKTAPPVIGRGQVMTYSIDVWNSAMATDAPNPYLLDFVPLNVQLITSSISHGGTVRTVSGTLGTMQVISWTLPALGTGARLEEPRTFAVRVNDGLVSGTQIVNQWYTVNWYENDPTYVGWKTNAGGPVTTTVKEIGLVDSYKLVTPTVASPGPGNVLTYTLHIVNSGPLSLTGVTVYDWLPWQSSTYQRDAVASAGQIVSDIVSIQWEGDVPAFSAQVVTFTVLVDADYRGLITNTAVISHPDLLEAVLVDAVAYITDEPVLQITKSASPDPVDQGAELGYTIRVTNLGQQATNLVITDVLPANTTYVAGGKLVGNYIRWQSSALGPGESRQFSFQVLVGNVQEVVNRDYAVTCAEGVFAAGAPVVTRVRGGGTIFLPLVMRNG